MCLTFSSLAGRVALITGASKGIGAAIAHELACSGFNVAVAARNASAVDSVVTGLASVTMKDSAAVLRHHGFKLDVTCSQSVKTCVDEVVASMGSLDVVVNCAGITQNQLLLRVSDSSIEDVLSTNLAGPIKVCRAAARPMLKQGAGVIINIGSVVGAAGNPGQSVYSASKAGLAGLTRSLSKELGPRGIRANLVEPGFITTDMTAGLPAQQIATIEASTPLGRLGSPEDVASVVRFFASDQAKFITGQVLRVDGGLSL